MIIYDFVRGYQPFYPPKFVPFWVKENLEQVFLPTSQAMREGVVPRHAVLQAWTLDNWLAAGGRVRSLAGEFILNIKEAVEEGHLQIGASAYTNALLPLLSDELVEFSIRTGVESVSKHFDAQPTWFWFPDGAVDQRVLGILHRLYPDLIAVIPDGCVGKKSYGGFGWVEHPSPCHSEELCDEESHHNRKGVLRPPNRRAQDDGPVSRQRIVIFNTLLKFLFLDSYMYEEEPVFVPERVNFDLATKMAYDSKVFISVLKSLGGGGEEAILMREWENKTSRDGLVKVGSDTPFARRPVMDISSFVEAGKELEFKLLSEDCWAESDVFKISQIKPSCWEPFASENSPYPLWLPGYRHSEFISESRPSRSRNKFGMTGERSVNLDYLTESQKAVIESWRSFLDTCNSVLSENLKVEYLPLLISDIPWNVLAPAERKPDPIFIKRIIEEMFMKIVGEVGDRKLSEKLERLYRPVNKFVKEAYEK